MSVTKAADIVTVTVETGTDGGGWEFANEATCEPDAAVVTARTLYDESYTCLQGCRRRIVYSATDIETGVTARISTQVRP